MANQLRKGVERLKLFYITKLIQTGHYNASDHELYTLTLSELEKLYKRAFSP